MDDPPPVHTLMIEVWTATPTILQSRRKRGGLMPHTLSFFSWDCRNMKWEWYQREGPQALKKRASGPYVSSLWCRRACLNCGSPASSWFSSEPLLLFSDETIEESQPADS